jgi:hypothetical protein
VFPVQKFETKLFADYFQFYLQDETSREVDPVLWTKDAVDQLLAVGAGYLMVGTVRNMTVPVTLEVFDREPPEEVGTWDQINECGLEVSSGRIVVAGCTDYFPDAARITVPPGWYRVRLFYWNLDALSEDGLEGDDFYKVFLWPSDGPVPLTVVKQRRIASKS